MTDREIIKALERSVEQNIRKNASCDGCSYEKVFPYCHSECSEDTLEVMYLDLIKRQKAETEEWKEEANRYQILWCEDVQTAKAEAIKEFAERLKAKAYEGQGYYSVFTVGDIDNLVKEMVGE